jgi:hypothetical protein
MLLKTWAAIDIWKIVVYIETLNDIVHGDEI